MHNEPPFSCPQCGDTGIGGERCLRCKIELVDRAGHPALAPPAVFLSRPTFDGFLHPWAMWVSGGALLISFLGFDAEVIPWWLIVLLTQVVLWSGITTAFFLVKDMRVKSHRRRLQAIRERVASASPVESIAKSSGNSHIRGRVRVIKPVKGPLGNPVGAYLVRAKKETVELLPAGRGQTRRAVTSITVEESSACGVFLVEDETGAVLVDDDAFTVAPVAGLKLDWDDPISLAVEDGGEVEIIGPTERKPASSYPELAKAGGYREAASLLVFNGTPEARVLIIASRAAGISNQG